MVMKKAKKAKIAILAACLTLPLFGIELYTPDDADSQTRVCPTSSVKCKVTFEHPVHGEITVDSEKGSNDDAVIIE